MFFGGVLLRSGFVVTLLLAVAVAAIFVLTFNNWVFEVDAPLRTASLSSSSMSDELLLDDDADVNENTDVVRRRRCRGIAFRWVVMTDVNETVFRKIGFLQNSFQVMYVEGDQRKHSIEICSIRYRMLFPD